MRILDKMKEQFLKAEEHRRFAPLSDSILSNTFVYNKIYKHHKN